MYQQGWTNDRLGLASATAWTMFLIIVLAVLVNLRLTRRRGEPVRGSAAATHWRRSGDQHRRPRR